MAIAESINRKIQGQKLLFAAETDTMIIGGVVSNLSGTPIHLFSTPAFLTIKPFVINAKIDQGFPYQIQTKILAKEGTEVRAFATENPVALLWDSDDGWNSGLTEEWNGVDPTFLPVLLNLTIAEI